MIWLVLTFLYHLYGWHYLRGADWGKKKVWVNNEVKSLGYKHQDWIGKLGYWFANKTVYSIGAGLLWLPIDWKCAIAVTLGMLLACGKGRQFDGMDGRHKSRLTGTLQGVVRNLLFLPLFVVTLGLQHGFNTFPVLEGLGLGISCGTFMALMHPFSNVIAAINQDRTIGAVKNKPTHALVERLESKVLAIHIAILLILSVGGLWLECLIKKG